LSVPERPPGTVHLVGAGPGDPGLLTARALELIARADTILYDRLIPARALEGARADAELLFVGKMSHHPGAESIPQERTQALMIERARAGREVVRLKGGDPFVFGRGGEEALALREAGIDFSVVPGVTAGVAAAAYAGIPVTHRGLSTAVALVTGHTREDTPEDRPAGERPPGAAPTDGSPGGPPPDFDWEALAAFPGTLVFYMGVRALEGIARALIEAGRPGAEAAALVERGTLPDQRTVTGTLATIAELARRERVRAPAIAIVGDVAGLAQDLAWLPARPLAGRTVTVTRARARASELARHLEELGASVVRAPSIRARAISDPTLPPLDPSPYDLICLSSPVGVERLFERLDDGVHPPGDARALAGARVAAIGPATARALRARGIVADVLPERFVAESLVEALAGVEVRRALVARARDARDVLPDALRARGAEVDVVALYETLAEPLPEVALEQARAADYVTFTSSSTVRFFMEGLRARARGRAVHPDSQDTPPPRVHNDEQPGPDRAPLAAHTRIVSIGPVTSATLREHGLEPHVEARRHDVAGLVEALLADAAERDG
jgi:uroporphyrinogen III methyltransferase/synthase